MRGPDHGRRYVAIEGTIGVGKTTLSNEIARRLKGRLILEEFEDNPFLTDFYTDRSAFAFSTQVFFLMSRFRQQGILSQGDLFARHTISDYFFEKDRIFATINLTGAELRLYDELFEVLRFQVAQPDLVVYLHADLRVVLSRIAMRGRTYESSMDPGYIAAVADAYDEYFANYRGSPVLRIDTTDLDVRYDVSTLDAIETAILRGNAAIIGKTQSDQGRRSGGQGDLFGT